MKNSKRLYGLALVPLLLGGYADTDVAQLRNGLTVTSLPSCAVGEYLTYRGGALVCDVPTETNPYPAPSCHGMGALLTAAAAGDQTMFACVPPGTIQLSPTDQLTLTNLQNLLTQLQNQVDPLTKGTRVAGPVYLGLSTTTTDGQMLSGNLSGLQAASALCAKDFGPGASMCNVYSIYSNVAAGKLPLTADIGPAWVYQAAWTASDRPGGSEPESGEADNCSGFTDNTDLQGYRGTAFRVQKPIGGTEWVPKFYNSTPCATVLPVACCL